jgi:hypothetical protein
LVAAQRRRTSSVLENRISPYSLRG